MLYSMNGAIILQKQRVLNTKSVLSMWRIWTLYCVPIVVILYKTTSELRTPLKPGQLVPIVSAVKRYCGNLQTEPPSRSGLVVEKPSELLHTEAMHVEFQLIIVNYIIILKHAYKI